MLRMRWLVAVLVLIGVALALQAGLVAFAGYVLLGVFLLARFLAREGIANLTATRTADIAPREIGDEVEVEVKVANGGRWPLPWALAEDLFPEAAVRQERVKLKGSRLKVLFLRAGATSRIKYKLTFRLRGYYQLGPLMAETGDVFGLHRRHKLLAPPVFVLVYPKVLPLAAFDFASARPVGEIRLANRLYEDPTRSAGVRPYQRGDPLQRIHWGATARTGELHSRIYEPTSLAGATLLIDFHRAGYPRRGEPSRSELAITLAASLAYAVAALNQAVGLASNGRDATERIRAESLAANLPQEFATRTGAREQFAVADDTDRLRPVVVETRRGFDQFEKIRETLARLELTDGSSFAQLVVEVRPRLPRDATVIAILPRVPVETSVALGQLRRQGYAVSVLLVAIPDEGSDDRIQAMGRLAAEGIRDVRLVNAEADLMALGDRSAAAAPSEYAFTAPLA